MDRTGADDARGNREGGEGGAVRLLAAFLFTIICGAFVAYFSNMYVHGDLNLRRFDILSESDNPELSIAGLPAKERMEVRGAASTLLFLEGNRQSIPFISRDRRTLSVRMSAYFPEVKYNRPGLTVTINGRDIGTMRPEWKGGIERLEFEIPASAQLRGANILAFGQTGSASYRIGYESIHARDFAGVSKRFPKAYVLFDENVPAVAKNPYARPYAYILYPAAFFLIWVVGANLIRAGRGVGALRASRTILYAYLPVCFVLTASAVFSGLSRYTVDLDMQTLQIFAFAPGAICVSYGIALYMRGRARLGQEGLDAKGAGAKTGRLGFIWPAAGAVYRNAGSIAVVVFAVFLSGAGVFLILKRQDIADRLADIAYFSIVFAVVVRAFELRGGKKGF